MNIPRLAVILSLILAAGCATHTPQNSQSPVPEPQPDAVLPSATQSLAPAVGPREVFAQFVLAIMVGNPGAIPPLCFASDNDAAKIISDFQALADATAQYRATLNATFGGDDGQAPFSFVTLDEVAALKETITRQTAQLTGDPVSRIDFRLIDGQWKIDVAQMRDNTLPENPHAYFKFETSAILRTAEDVKSGRLPTTASARAALDARQSVWPPATNP